MASDEITVTIGLKLRPPNFAALYTAIAPHVASAKTFLDCGNVQLAKQSLNEADSVMRLQMAIYNPLPETKRS